MANILSWANPNNRSDFTTKIYRSTSTFTKDTLPGSPVATLTNGEVVWKDTTSLFGVEYFYMLACQDAGGTYYSKVVAMKERVDTPWATQKDNTLLHGGASYGQASNVTFGDIPDDFLYYVYRKLGVAPSGEFQRLVINGRYFLVPEVPILTTPQNFIANNWFLGHRTPVLPSGANPAIFGTNEPTVWYGRKYSIGFPKMFPAGQTALMINLVSELSDAKGRVTFSKMANYEAVMFMAQSYVSMKHDTIPLNVHPARASISTTYGAVISCDASFSSSATAPTIACYNNATSPTSATMAFVSTAAAQYMLPMIEYLGTI